MGIGRNSGRSIEMAVKPYSLRDLSMLSAGELASKTFTFDPKVAKNKDLSQIVKDTLGIQDSIRELRCTKGIEDEFLPQFKFFQIKKSRIRSGDEEPSKIMLCFSDISQKILYDTSRSEKELLSLINSTISHEMRNPLNSIIN